MYHVELLILIGGAVALIVGILDDMRHIVWAKRVQHVECVLTISRPSFRVTIWEVHHQLLILLDEWIDFLNRQFVKLWHVDGSES